MDEQSARSLYEQQIKTLIEILLPNGAGALTEARLRYALDSVNLNRQPPMAKRAGVLARTQTNTAWSGQENHLPLTQTVMPHRAKRCWRKDNEMADMNITVSITPADLLAQISLHELCVAAVNKMVEDEVDRHISFISGEDDLRFGLKEGGKIPKVTIEWVDESEADPKNFESGITSRAVDGASCACPVNSADTTLICQQCGLPVPPRN